MNEPMKLLLTVCAFGFLFSSCLGAEDPEDFDFSVTVKIPKGQKYVPLMVKWEEGEKYFSSTTFALSIHKVFVDGKEVVSEQVRLPDMDMRQWENGDEVVGYVANLRALYSTYTKADDPYDFEVRHFSIPMDFTEVVIQYRARMETKLGPLSECRVVLRRKEKTGTEKDSGQTK